MNVGWDHLIHRKRSPFPYEGKDLSAVEGERSHRVVAAATLRSPDCGNLISIMLSGLRSLVSFKNKRPIEEDLLPYRALLLTIDY